MRYYVEGFNSEGQSVLCRKANISNRPNIESMVDLSWNVGLRFDFTFGFNALPGESAEQLLEVMRNATQLRVEGLTGSFSDFQESWLLSDISVFAIDSNGVDHYNDADYFTISIFYRKADYSIIRDETYME